MEGDVDYLIAGTLANYRHTTVLPCFDPSQWSFVR